MPYVSDAQRRWAHTTTGTKALGGPEKVKEWDRASKGKDLPMKAGWKGGGPVTASYAKGGPVLKEGPDRFMKQPDVFRTDSGPGARQDYGKSGKGGAMSKLEGETKVEKTIKPRT